MPFRPNVNDTLTIDGTDYRFTQHPAVSGMPYGQSGRKGTVYQVREEGAARRLRAFKVFHRAFQEPRLAIGAQRLEPFASLPGLEVCARKALTPETHSELVTREPDLAYAVLMPWVSGNTWQEIVLGQRPLKPEQSQLLAQRFLQILATMEAQGIAHCDLSGPNVMLALDSSDGPALQLVDVEDLYAPELPPPQRPPAGSPGYAHRTASGGLWSPDADRFAGAVILAEQLGWCESSVRQIAAGEHFFAANELQQPSERFQVLLQALRTRYGAGVEELFARAWHSATLGDCPTFAEWQQALGAPKAIDAKTDNAVRRKLEEAQQLLASGKTDLGIAALEQAYRQSAAAASVPYSQALQRRAEAREQEGDVVGALADYRAAHAVAPPGAMRNELASIIRLVQAQLAPPEERTEVADPAEVVPAAEVHTARPAEPAPPPVEVQRQPAAVQPAVTQPASQPQPEQSPQPTATPAVHVATPPSVSPVIPVHPATAAGAFPAQRPRWKHRWSTGAIVAAVAAIVLVNLFLFGAMMASIAEETRETSPSTSGRQAVQPQDRARTTPPQFTVVARTPTPSR